MILIILAPSGAALEQQHPAVDMLHIASACNTLLLRHNWQAA